RCLGVLPYADLPRYVRHADVGLIPFRLGDVSAGATPGKLFQYLAAGLPVVATDFLRDDAVRKLVYVALEEAEDFATTIDRALLERSDTLRAERIAFARQNSWDAQDRKSTRLNSSHVAISYAVFCLKKKTTADNHQHTT